MKQCQTCQGVKVMTVKCRDRSGKRLDGMLVEGIVTCSSCNGKGFITQQDIDNYYKTWELS